MVTGGAGYIGSHATVALLDAGHEVVILDNFCNSSTDVVTRISKISTGSLTVITGDVSDKSILASVFSRFSFDAVFHFAGYKSVSESVSRPLTYFQNNFCGTLALLEAMSDAGVFKLLFSSSATVYGHCQTVPVPENSLISQPTSPYGRSKLMVEQMLFDLGFADPRWRIAILRYFNPVGAHPSGLIGEEPRGIPNNLFPYISLVATGKLKELSIYGIDYSTLDGTGVRDYIHVMDLVTGHLCALDALASRSGAHVWNLGTGQGHSVLQIVQAFEAVTGRIIPYKICPRRPGDIATCYADPSKAAREIGWRSCRSLDEMVADFWHWIKCNADSRI